MDYQVSARKYRPGTFDDVIGQPHVVQTLMNAVSTKRIAHAYLFSGTRGVGKTTVARILAKALNCEQGPTSHPCNTCENCREIVQGNSVDVIEIDGASNTSVDDVREIRENVKFTPFRGQFRVYIIDEVHMLSNSAFNALLKTLEEPPTHVVFIFATTEIHKIPATILSRCQHYNFRRIARTEIIERLRHVAAQDQLTLEEQSFVALARTSEGSMRDALSLLDQAVAYGGKVISHTDLELLLGAVPQELVQELIRAIMAQDSPAALASLANLLDRGHDLRAFCAEVVEHIRNLLVAAVVPGTAELRGLIETSEDDLNQLSMNAKTLTPEQLQELLAIFIQAEDSLRFSSHPRFVMETAAVRATRLLRQREGTEARPIQTASSSNQKPPAEPERRKSGPSAPPALRQGTPVASRPIPQPIPTSKRETDEGPSISPGSSHNPPADVAAATVSPTAVDPQPTLQWELVQEEVAASFPNIAPFLEAGRFVGIEGGFITIGFAKQATVARARLEKEENLLVLSRLCERQLRYPIRVRIIELTETHPPGLTMAQVRAAKEQEQRLVLFERARANPTVKQALEIFGVELAEVRTITQQEASE
ncbi:MAG: DNA polymerase III subunit gamma/tau [Nitrospira sp.]|nr:DNA polymerase III subunit gamma/tau [Nitrospira sp.]MDI3465586.1 DNA polymerase III subunits gamma and tau [Nitrospira sp.]